MAKYLVQYLIEDSGTDIRLGDVNVNKGGLNTCMEYRLQGWPTMA